MRSIAAFAVKRGPLVLLLWLLVVAGVNVAVPQLDDVIRHDSTSFIPDYADSMKAFRHLDQAFGTGKSESFVFVVAERDSGLNDADRAWFTKLTTKLAADHTNFGSVPDLSQPGLWDALKSKDGKALYVQLGLPGPVGAPQTMTEVNVLRADIVNPPAGLNVKTSGNPATIVDTQAALQKDIGTITIVTLVLIAIILFLLYRSVPIMATVLTFIGISLGLGRGAAAFAGHNHIFHVSTFTASFVTAVVLGAATDYAIFLLSRFQEMRRNGMDAREAAVDATAKTASVITGSALTVALAMGSMAFTHIAFFSTTGPAVALAIVCTLALSLTFLPALIAFAGPRGWLDPKNHRSGAGWTRVSNFVVKRPARVMALGLLPLVVLALFYPMMKVTYDQRRVQPAGTESEAGFQLLDRHFPPNEILADYILITSDHDVRNSSDLAAIERAAAGVAAVPGVASVRTVTRPLGTTIPQASLAYQMGQAGQQLGNASNQVAQGAAAAQQLNSGANQLSSGASKAASGAQQVLNGANQLAAGLPKLASGASSASSGSSQLQAGANQLAAALSAGADQAQAAVDGLGLAYSALQSSLTCGIDPFCSQARTGIGQIYVAERDKLVPGMRQAAAAASQLASGAGSLGNGLSQLQAGLATANAGAAQLRDGQAVLASKLGDLAGGASQLAGGTGQISGAVSQLGSGLSQATTFLNDASATAQQTATGGFYLPPAAFSDPRFATASNAFISPDGKSVRIISISATNGVGNAAIARAPKLMEAARTALAGTPLAKSAVEMTGTPAAYRDIKTLSTEDFNQTALAAFLIVLIILLLLLRSIVASLFLLGSVILSYAAAMGLGVLVWQVLLGKEMDWTVPSIAFVLLVAVGADYNMLLVKRIHDEAPNGERAGIAKAVAITGSVITAAGLIFASSIFAMMAGSVLTLEQLGFTVGMGLLLDTFVVRTLVVPAFATLAGNWLWWPSQREGNHPHADDAVPPAPPVQSRTAALEAANA